MLSVLCCSQGLLLFLCFMYVFGILPRPVCSLLQDGFTWPGTIVPGLFSALFQGQFSVDAFLLFCYNDFTASRQRRLMMRPVESLLGPVHAGRRTMEDTKSVNIQKKKKRAGLIWLTFLLIIPMAVLFIALGLNIAINRELTLNELKMDSMEQLLVLPFLQNLHQLTVTHSAYMCHNLFAVICFSHNYFTTNEKPRRPFWATLASCFSGLFCYSPFARDPMDERCAYFCVWRRMSASQTLRPR